MTAIRNFERNYEDVLVLFDVHGALTGGVQGQGRHLTPAVLKSSILLMCAAWEAYVEDVCLEASVAIASGLSDPSRLPTGVQQKILTTLATDRHQLAGWRVAGEGWKQLYTDEVARLCDGLEGGLNTPNAKNVRDLYKAALGIPDVTVSWSWQAMQRDQACRKLNSLVSLRGSLAHGRAEPGLNIGTARGFALHIERLVRLLQASADEAVAGILTP